MALRRRDLVSRRHGRPIAVLLLAILVGLRILDPGIVEGVREASFDAYRVLEGGRAPLPEGRVVAVAIDEQTLARFGQWPWPRDLLARLVEAISRGGPKAVALNVLLPESDRMSPARIVEHLDGLSPGARGEILSRPSADEQLARALARVPSVLSMAATRQAARSRNAAGLKPHEIVFAGYGSDVELPSYGGIIRSLYLFTRSAAGEGVVNFELDGGVVRRLPSAVRVRDVVLPSLAIQMINVGSGGSQIVGRTGLAGLEAVIVGGMTIPTDPHGNVRARFVQPSPGAQISAGSVLAGEISPELFRGRYVMIGATASGLTERYAAPGAGLLTGLQLHSQLLGSMLAGQLLVRPWWAFPAEIALLVLTGIGLVQFLPALRPLGEFGLLLGTAVALAGIGLGGYLIDGLLIDVSWILITSLLLFLLIAGQRLIAEERGSRELARRMQVLEATLDTVPVPVVICSLTDDALLYANASARESLDIGRPSQRLAETSAVLKRSNDWERLLTRLHVEGRVDGFEAPVNASRGEMLALLAARRLDYQGDDAALVACVDITERNRIENELRFSRDEAQRASQSLRDAQADLVQAEKMASLGSLVAGVAHEINTPVGVALAGASHLVDRGREVRRIFEGRGLRRSEFVSFLEAVEESAQLVASNIQRAADLIQGFKRVSVDQTSEQQQIFDLGEYLNDVIISLRAEVNRSGKRVEVDCPEEITLDSYPGAIALIVTNMVVNALTHAFPPGAAGLIRITARSVDDEVELRCIDNGVGMPDDVVARIFDPFFTTRRGRGGSGLGLYLVFNTVTQVLRGRVEVESEEGKGTSFLVRFPRVVTAAHPGLADMAAVRSER